jgi:hypothetical protein
MISVKLDVFEILRPKNCGKTSPISLVNYCGRNEFRIRRAFKRPNYQVVQRGMILF